MRSRHYVGIHDRCMVLQLVKTGSMIPVSTRNCRRCFEGVSIIAGSRYRLTNAIEASVQRMCLGFRPVLYVTPRNPSIPGQRTVFVDAINQSGRMPAVYMEDRLVVDQG